MAYTLDPNLREYAKDSQWEKLKALEKYGTERKAAKAIGVHRKCFDRAKKRVAKVAAQKGYCPERDLVHPVGPGMSSKGTSIRYDSDGNVQQYWNKTKQEGRSPEEVVHLPDPKTVVKLSTLYDQEGNVAQQWVAEKPDAVAQVYAWEEFAKALAEELPRVEPQPLSDIIRDDDLLVAYPVGDHHLGMLAWDKETGDDYDMKISEDLLNKAMTYLVETAPAAKQGLVVFLGDFLHYDSIESVTPASRNQLDADSRFPKMVRAGIRCMKYAISKALCKHENVHVIVESGNHDPYSTVFLMECLYSFYENEPRVTVDTSPKHYHYYRFGNNLIGTHHGHGTNMKNLPLIMATDRPEDWGQTQHRFWWTGHIHKSKTQAATSSDDFSGCTVESFRILATLDAWAHQKGYRSKREMHSIILHRETGSMSRNTVNPQMFA